MKYDYLKIGMRIATERKNLNIKEKVCRIKYASQTDFIDMLADRGVKISRSTLSKIETGDADSSNISLDFLLACCDIFDCELGYLLCEPEYEYKTRSDTDICNNLKISIEALKSIKDMSLLDDSSLPYGNYDEFYNAWCDETYAFPGCEKYAFDFILKFPEFKKFISYFTSFAFFEEGSIKRRKLGEIINVIYDMGDDFSKSAKDQNADFISFIEYKKALYYALEDLNLAKAKKGNLTFLSGNKEFFLNVEDLNLLKEKQPDTFRNYLCKYLEFIKDEDIVRIKTSKASDLEAFKTTDHEDLGSRLADYSELIKKEYNALLEKQPAKTRKQI